MSRPTSAESLQLLPDQTEYLTLGRNLLHGRGLWFIDPRYDAKVLAYRMPGYPAFIAAGGGNVRVVRAMQAVVDTSTVLAVYLLAGLLLGTQSGRARIFAAALVAVNPLMIYFSGLILSETIFIAMLTWGMVLLLAGFGREDRPGHARIWLSGGLLIALAVLVRPSAGLLPLLLGIAALFVNHGARAAYQSSPTEAATGRWPLPVGTTMVLLVGLVLLPWAWRNYREVHHLIWTDTNGGITLYDGNNGNATGASNQEFVQHMPQLRSMDEVGRSQYFTDQSTQFIEKNPLFACQLALKKIGRTWSPMPLSEQFGNHLYIIILLGYSIPFDIFVICGLFFKRISGPAKKFLLLPAIYFTIVHAITIGSLRYRVPAEPALAVIAASVFAVRAPMRKRADK